MLRSVVVVGLAGWLGLGSAHADDVDPLYSCKVPAAGTKLSVNIAPDVSLKDLATWVTGFTCKNIVFASDVAKHATKLTIISPQKMTAKQGLQLFVDAVEATGLVVQIKPDTIIIKLGPNMPKNCPDATVSSKGGDVLAPWPGDLSAPAEQPEADRLAMLDKGIKKIDATHYEITAATLDAILANPMAVAKGARIVPVVTAGKPNGFRLYAIRPSSIYAKVGFMNGDSIVAINGFALESADKALEVYTSLREAKNIDIAVVRRDKPITISIKITK
jgi:membrane-associated protease RseP (regulator of RpoE activity)